MDPGAGWCVEVSSKPQEFRAETAASGWAIPVGWEVSRWVWELGLAARQKEELEQRHGGVGTLPERVAGDEASDKDPDKRKSMGQEHVRRIRSSGPC